MPEHQVRIAGTVIEAAIRENVEDGIAEVLRHYQDAMVSGKASKVVIELSITPDNNRQRFQYSVSRKQSMSPRETFSSDFYGGVNAKGELQVAEFNPNQMRMFSEEEMPVNPPERGQAE